MLTSTPTSFLFKSLFYIKKSSVVKAIGIEARIYKSRTVIRALKNMFVKYTVKNSRSNCWLFKFLELMLVLGYGNFFALVII